MKKRSPYTIFGTRAFKKFGMKYQTIEVRLFWLWYTLILYSLEWYLMQYFWHGMFVFPQESIRTFADNDRVAYMCHKLVKVNVE